MNAPVIYRKYRYGSLLEEECDDSDTALASAMGDYEHNLAAPHEIQVGVRVYERDEILDMLKEHFPEYF